MPLVFEFDALCNGIQEKNCIHAIHKKNRNSSALCVVKETNDIFVVEWRFANPKTTLHFIISYSRQSHNNIPHNHMFQFRSESVSSLYTLTKYRFRTNFAVKTVFLLFFLHFLHIFVFAVFFSRILRVGLGY